MNVFKIALFCIVTATAFAGPFSWARTAKLSEVNSLLAEKVVPRPDGTGTITFRIFTTEKHKNTRFEIDPKKGVFVHFGNGNVAMLGHEVTPRIDSVFPFIVESSTCSEEIKSRQCTFVYPYKSDDLRYVWQKHSDTEKVGTLVNGYGNSEFSKTYDWHFAAQKLFPNRTHDMTPEFYCDDYTWLGHSSGAPESIRLREWAVEEMEDNLEVSSNENQVRKGFLGANLSLNTSGKFTLDGFDYLMGFNDFGYFPMVGDIVGWTVETPNRLCEVAFKPDPRGLQKLIQKITELTTKPKPFHPEMDPYLGRLFYRSGNISGGVENTLPQGFQIPEPFNTLLHSNAIGLFFQDHRGEVNTNYHFILSDEEIFHIEYHTDTDEEVSENE